MARDHLGVSPAVAILTLTPHEQDVLGDPMRPAGNDGATLWSRVHPFHRWPVFIQSLFARLSKKRLRFPAGSDSLDADKDL